MVSLTEYWATWFTSCVDGHTQFVYCYNLQVSTTSHSHSCCPIATSLRLIGLLFRTYCSLLSRTTSIYQRRNNHTMRIDKVQDPDKARLQVFQRKNPPQSCIIFVRAASTVNNSQADFQKAHSSFVNSRTEEMR